jgi:hypothetical protein
MKDQYLGIDINKEVIQAAKETEPWVEVQVAEEDVSPRLRWFRVGVRSCLMCCCFRMISSPERCTSDPSCTPATVQA